jgi:hypothetical protein
MFASARCGVARADNYTADQLRIIGKIYQWSRYYGADTALMLRIAYRETQFGANKQGDGGHSVGVFQWWDKGVWFATPCAKLGLAARWNEDADISCAAWAMSRGYASHWRPWQHTRWLTVVPLDPR